MTSFYDPTWLTQICNSIEKALKQFFSSKDHFAIFISHFEKNMYVFATVFTDQCFMYIWINGNKNKFGLKPV